MNAKNTADLRRNFPTFFDKNFYFECNDGWFPLIRKLCEDLAAFHIPDLKAVQVKEKFGGLRFYIDPFTAPNKKIKEEVGRFIAKAEHDSYTICECCGDPGRRTAIGYYEATRCTSCVPEKN